VRVLVPILEVTVASPDELYQAVQTIDWSRYLTPEHTLAVDSNVRDSRITHSKYAALRVKMPFATSSWLATVVAERRY